MSTPKYTEASVEEALLILDNARDCSLYADNHALMMAIDMAAQKLRGVQLSPEDAEALELASKHPIDLPWMQPEGCQKFSGNWHCKLPAGHTGYCAVVPNEAAPMVVIASDTPAPKCSQLSCEGCPTCQ